MGWGNLAPEVIVYYRMISNKAKEDSGIEVENIEDDDELLSKIRSNIDKLAAIMEESSPQEDLPEFDDDDPRQTHTLTKKVIH